MENGRTGSWTSKNVGCMQLARGKSRENKVWRWGGGRGNNRVQEGEGFEPMIPP